MSQFITFVLLGVIFEEQMEHQMELFLCYVSLMILLAMLIRVVAKERVCFFIVFTFISSIVFRNSYELLKLRCICCILGTLAC